MIGISRSSRDFLHFAAEINTILAFFLGHSAHFLVDGYVVDPPAPERVYLIGGTLSPHVSTRRTVARFIFRHAINCRYKFLEVFMYLARGTVGILRQKHRTKKIHSVLSSCSFYTIIMGHLFARVCGSNKNMDFTIYI